MKLRSFYQILTAFVLTGVLLIPMTAQAVPSFARQTGMDCAVCHTVFPQLTPFGRMFKLSGYTMASGAFTNENAQSGRLQEDVMAPLSAMLQLDYTSMKKDDAVPGGANNMTKDTVQIPQQFSIFYAGRISNYLGAFAQATLDSTNTFAMDNTDIRFAKTSSTSGGTSVTYGLSLNNSPMVEDILNSTPVWGFPFSAADYAHSPAYGTQLGTGAFAQTTGGLVAYAMINNTWYLSGGIYHDTQATTRINTGSKIEGLKGWAPYARFAFQKDYGTSNFDVGAYTINGKLSDDVADPMAPTTKFNDIGVDGQYQYINGVHTATVRANYISEKLTDPNLVFSAVTTGTLKIRDANLNGEYYYDRMYGAGLGYFTTKGDSDTGLYGATNPSGNPDSAGWLANLNYLPWLNTKFTLQYTYYSKFDGGSTYTSETTGVTRSAKDNNTLYLAAWFMF